MEYRFIPPAAAWVEQIHAGRVDTLRMLSIREHRFPFLHKVGNWYRFARNAGGTMVEKCRFANGVRAMLDLCMFAEGAEEQETMAAGLHPGETFYQHLAFAAAVRGEAPVRVTVHDGLMAVAMGIAAECSAREHRVVEMAEVPG